MSAPGDATADRRRAFSGAPWESSVGYCRAVRAGNSVFVAGTTAATPEGGVVGPGDAYAQTVHILRTIERALQEVGASLQDVVRTRMFVTDISRWPEIGRAHGEFFRNIQPAATMVQVAALIDPALLVEIEVDAVIA
jgi:enamine deaminase RidA (YjgF/YER057c/UK114 family)